MHSNTSRDRILELFADILEYPGEDLLQQVRACEALVSPGSPKAAGLLSQFGDVVEETSSGRVEEIYTGIFDLDSDSHPYLGYQLFGESYERSAFLLELKEQYRLHGYEPVENELPDRISVVLRFLSVCGDGVQSQEIIDEGLIPALDKMDKEVEEDTEERVPRESDPYRQVLQALRGVLAQLPSVTGQASSLQEESSNVR